MKDAGPIGAPEVEGIGATPLLSVAWKVVAALGALGILVLGVGLALPAAWDVDRTIRIDAPADSIYRWLDDPIAWQAWTVWGGVELMASGPERGAGATLRWDDPYLGDGVFTVVATEPPRLVRYRVEVEGGAMVTEGRLTLTPAQGTGTTVTWHERGDFGWNPMMGYAALNMGRIQGVELERALRRLEALVETGTVPDSLVPPAAPG